MLASLREKSSPSRAEGDFLPGALRLVELPPSPAPRRLLYWVSALIAIALLWLVFGRVDIVDHQDIGAGELGEQPGVRAVGLGEPDSRPGRLETQRFSA